MGVQSLVLGCALTLAVGCSGKSRNTGGAEEAGAAGSNGASGGTTAGGAGGATTGGSGSGTGGFGGSSGSAAGGTSGSAAGGTSGGVSGRGTGGDAGLGGAGIAGASGGGAASAVYPECQSAIDCTMVSDCCGCRAESPNHPAFCSLDCERDACAESMIAPSEVACVQGRCVISRGCDAGSVTCRAAPPSCPDGMIPSVLDECWGPCLPPTECAWVTDCSDCGDAFCVEFQAQRSSFSCVTRVGECNRENYCECLGVCGECSETDDMVACPCLGC